MWKYVGNGEFIPGIPARDLTDEEAAAHMKDVVASRLYEKVAPQKGRKVEPRRLGAKER